MYKLKQHIVFKVSTILLALTFLLPSVVNFIHNIEHTHKYELCDNPHDVHLHKLDKDCDFCKIKVRQDYYSIATNYKLAKPVIPTECFSALYSFQYNYQHLSFSLRAPPLVI
ncbi:MAG: hypothetical protein ACPGRW_09295 [Flavobacteriaceae bacterium]